MQRANSSAQEAPEAEGHIPSSPGKVAPNLFLYFWWRAGAVDQSKLFPMYFWCNFGFTFDGREEEQVLLTNPSRGPEHLFDRSARILQFYNWLLSNAQNLIALYLLYLNGGTAVMFQYIFAAVKHPIVMSMHPPWNWRATANLTFWHLREHIEDNRLNILYLMKMQTC